MLQSKLQSILNDTVDNKKIFGTSFALKNKNAMWQGASGNLKTEDPYFIASTTKLFTTALIYLLKAEGRLKLDQPVCDYFDSSFLNGLHHIKGSDYTQNMTIKHLLSHTSGLPDYFQNKGPNGVSLEDELKDGRDQAWSFDQAMERTRVMQALFIPGTKGKAHYSDSNFQLLGRIIEILSGKSYATNCLESIIQPLQLNDTYLYTDSSDKTPAQLYFKSSVLPIPKAMTSFRADGGMVSTSHDLLRFIEAFFEGKIFPKEELLNMQHWNSIFFPMQSGVGMHLFKLPWIFNPFGTVPYFMGHSGLSGALAYYCPKTETYIAGTVNQIAYPDLSFRTMIKLHQAFNKN